MYADEKIYATNAEKAEKINRLIKTWDDMHGDRIRTLVIDESMGKMYDAGEKVEIDESIVYPKAHVYYKKDGFMRVFSIDTANDRIWWSDMNFLADEISWTK